MLDKKIYIFFFIFILSPFLSNSQDLPSHVPEIDVPDEDKKIDYQNLPTKDFFSLYSKTVNNSLNRHPKIGKTCKKGHILNGLKGGTFTYYCYLAGWNKVIVEMIYDKYKDFDFSISGTIILNLTWNADGTMEGKIYVDYPIRSEVEYSLIIEKGIESNGNYILTIPNRGSSIIPWDFLSGKTTRTYSIDKIN